MVVSGTKIFILVITKIMIFENLMEKLSVKDAPVCSSNIENEMLQSNKIDSKEKMVLNYSKDQWSPYNPEEGKKKYDREFLLSMQFHPLCLRKPKTLLNFDPHRIISEKKKEKKALDKKNIHRFLSKLTTGNFDKLIDQVTELNIDTEEKLNEATSAIIQKFVEEPLSRELYVKLCLCLTVICVPLNNELEQVEFRQVLILRCQMEFEKELSELESKREQTIKAMNSSEIEKHELLMKLEEEKQIVWKRISAIVLLISELFRLNMLSQHIMNECIQKLLSLEDEKSLECLCDLFKRIGKELDEVKKEKNPGDTYSLMDQYITQIQKIIFRRYTSEKNLNKFRNILDLKQKDWVPQVKEMQRCNGVNF